MRRLDLPQRILGGSHGIHFRRWRRNRVGILAGLRLNRRWLRCNIRGAAMFYEIETAKNKEESRADASENARPEKFRKALPPRGGSRRDARFSVADYSFGFQLGANGNPDAVGRSDLGRNAFGSNNYSGKIGKQILTVGATGEMLARFLGKRTETLGF